MTYIKKLMATSAAGLGGALILTGAASALIQTADIADGAVTSRKIANFNVHNADLRDGAVTSPKIKNGTIKSYDMANGAVITKKIASGAVTGSRIDTDTNINLAHTRNTSNDGSYQNLSGDVTYAGGAGGTSAYHAGVMGNFLGTVLSNTTSSYHAGVIGSYNVETSDASTGAESGVVGEVGTNIGTANSVTAVLGGDDGTLTPNAAYGVQYFNSTAASKFDYGLDLFHAATADYTGVSAVDFGTADIRFSSGNTLATGAGDPTGACTTGNLYLDSTGGTDTTVLWVCENSLWAAK